MEVIQISGYTDKEKLNIATEIFSSQTVEENSLKEDEISFNDDAILAIIHFYTRESGVRNLEREIGSVCRKIATSITENSFNSSLITPEIVNDLLGKPKYFETDEIIRRTSTPGVAIGLAWTPVGGEILFIEATKMDGNKTFLVTGSIGKVMEESAKIALSLVRSKFQELNIDPEVFEKF